MAFVTIDGERFIVAGQSVTIGGPEMTIYGNEDVGPTWPAESQFNMSSAQEASLGENDFIRLMETTSFTVFTGVARANNAATIAKLTPVLWSRAASGEPDRLIAIGVDGSLVFDITSNPIPPTPEDDLSLQSVDVSAIPEFQNVPPGDYTLTMQGAVTGGVGFFIGCSETNSASHFFDREIRQSAIGSTWNGTGSSQGRHVIYIEGFPALLSTTLTTPYSSTIYRIGNGNTRGAPDLYVYKNLSNTIAVATSIDWFDGVPQHNIKAGDLMYVQMSDGFATLSFITSTTAEEV